MRVRILRDIRLSGAPSISWTAGSVAIVPQDIADKWFKQGIAMEDKAIEPSENKSKQDKIREQTRTRVQNFRDRKKGNDTQQHSPGDGQPG